MRKRELTDAQWAALAPHLPPQRARTGRPAKDHRLMGEGILCRLRTGVPWRDLPEHYGPWQSGYSRFRRWQQAGVWERALAALQADADGRGELDRSLHFRDATNVRAHPHAAGAKKGGPKGGGDHALGRSRGGWGTKLHLRTERGGKPVTWTLTGGQTGEATQVPALLAGGAVARRGARARLRPDRVAGDRAYTGRAIRRELRRRKIGAVIPRQRTEPRRGVRFDRAAYRERNVAERSIRRLKHHRAIATRSDKLEVTFHATLPLAIILLWLPV